MIENQGTDFDASDKVGALTRSNAVATRLSVTARKLRLTTSKRSDLFKAVGLRPKLIDRLFKAAAYALTFFLLIAPILTSLAYFGFIATDQYQSEARFTVRSSSPALGKDRLAKVTGLPSAKIVQDTQIATNYISSGEMVRRLQGAMDFDRIYGSDTIDFFARLDVGAPFEERLEYWEKMVSSQVSATSGIVIVKVKAFSATDAQLILRQVIAASEIVINDVNDRIWNDVIATSQRNVQDAATTLQKSREKLQVARNKAGILDVSGTSTLINNLLGDVQKEILALQQRYDSQPTTVSRNAPHMRVLQREIASKQQQAAQLKSQIAGQQATGNLANVSLDMSQLELEQGLAERQFAAAVKTVEQVQFVSRQQLIYLDSFLEPTFPDRAEYPRSVFWIATTIVVSLIVWSAALGLLHMFRNRLT
ncbi:capsule biosynthesis protein [Agrobacterium rosae]|uniref:capsule biosynthesis protein n=1 Tax=Agrobacterium rosae TaxID=1972867 RepID=UPI000CD86ABD|nr:capsule biosynthesis protein [Agrobacterium rosae]POO52112.1 capsule biosynthesis protein [Agrobacterium rosae]